MHVQFLRKRHHFLFDNIMNSWSSTPFFRILLPFGIGILLSVFTTDLFDARLINGLFYVEIFLMLLLALGIWINRLSANYAMRWIWGICIHILLILLGITYTYSSRENVKESHYTHHVKEATHARICILEPPSQKEEYIKTTVEIQGLFTNQKWIKTTGKALIKIESDSISNHLKYGDCLIIANEFKEIKSFPNPGEANFSNYLLYKNIYRQAYLSKGSWIKLNENKGNALSIYAYHLRDQLIGVFRKYMIKKEEVAVASALLIGFTDEIDSNLRKAYSVAGVMHVLSVSGMHVGIIYVLLAYLLFFMEKNKWMRIGKSILLISFLWFYALLTGLSPAVLRAALMLTLVIIGKTLNRESNTLNILLASAFLLILSDPLMLLSIGFQLSFLAVAGIVVFQDWIYEWLEFRNKYADKIWKLTAVSLAAQLSTFPLGLYYFKQFPNYFIIANMLVIPLATVVMYACLALLVISPMQTISVYAGKLCCSLVSLLNSTVVCTEKLPASVTGGFSIDIKETLLIYALILCIFWYSQKRKPMYLMLSIFSICCLFASNTYARYLSVHQKKLIVYNIRKTTAIDFISGEESIFIGDSSIINNLEKKERYIEPAHQMMNIQKLKIIPLLSHTQINNSAETQAGFQINKQFISFINKRMYLLNDKKILKNKNARKIHVDFIILSGNINCKIEAVRNQFDCQKIIIDPSNSMYKTKKWIKECETLKLAYHAVSLSGPFIQEY